MERETGDRKLEKGETQRERRRKETERERTWIQPKVHLTLSLAFFFYMIWAKDKDKTVCDIDSKGVESFLPAESGILSQPQEIKFMANP